MTWRVNTDTTSEYLQTKYRFKRGLPGESFITLLHASEQFGFIRSLTEFPFHTENLTVFVVLRFDTCSIKSLTFLFSAAEEKNKSVCSGNGIVMSTVSFAGGNPKDSKLVVKLRIAREGGKELVSMQCCSVRMKGEVSAQQ